MKRYVISVVSIAMLYTVNRFYLTDIAVGKIREILVCHGADFLAGAMMLCLLNLLLTIAGRAPLRKFLTATLFFVGCGFFWEVITPLYLPRSVGDAGDVLACWLGGITMWLIERKYDIKGL